MSRLPSNHNELMDLVVGDHIITLREVVKLHQSLIHAGEVGEILRIQTKRKKRIFFVEFGDKIRACHEEDVRKMT